MGLWNFLTDVGHAVTGIPTAKEKRAQMNMANEQIKAYKDQTRMAQEELDRKRGETAAEKRRVNEKQVRMLRRNFKPAGFLDNGSDLQSKLGA
jgi:hypothetical protein